MSDAPQELRAGVVAAIRDRFLATVDELGADAVLWLAAPPLWSLGAAQAAGFPASPVIEFVRRACAAGWCKARGSLRDDAAPDLLFWMPDEVRREVVDVLRDLLGSESVVRDLILVAASVTASVTDARSRLPRREAAAEPAGDELPGALLAWAELMTKFSPGASPRRPKIVGNPPHSPDDQLTGADLGTALVLRTQQAVAARDLSRAQDLVAAGEAIAGMLAGATEQALSRVRRLLALGLRRRQDERALGRYLDRPELSDAVARLLNRSAPADLAAPPWALHLRGVGGVGKTMLIRYLASGLYAADRGMAPIPVARADFDHISPDYPVRRPVQLLLELADELALHTAASYPADLALSAFRARAARAHEAVSGLREAGGSPLRNPEVARAVDGFGAVLAELGDVVLILDTCEELAKADLGNPAAPAVRATLDIIERLHRRAPSARVLFAGRRPLPGRPYLTVQPVAGFTVAEARRYLAASAGRPLPPDLADEMIRQSPAVDGPVPAAGRMPDRVSPFDLALYAAWADEDPDLDAAQVRRGSDAYVEGRIIERLADPLVVRALPVLASAGRCRVTTIATFLGCDPAALGRRLAEQEWIDVDGDPPAHVAARPALASKLRRYFESGERRAEFAAGNAALASALLARVRAVPLAEIDVDELIAALRLARPADAAALWDSIADAATRPPGRWGTVLNMTRRIIGEWDEEEWPTTGALRATVLAAHIAASRRDSPLFDPSGPWETVRASAGQHPDPGARQRLLARAVFGLLPGQVHGAAPLASGTTAGDTGTVAHVTTHVTVATTTDEAPWAGTPASETVPLDSRESVSVNIDEAPELAAALVDAATRMLEAGDSDLTEGLIAAALPAALFPTAALPTTGLSTMRRLTALPGRLPGPRVQAWALVARARGLADSDRTAAVDALAAAESLAAAATDQEPAWPDLILPDDLLARVRIERGLIAPPDDVAVLDEWESYAADRLDTIDGERLASLCLRVRLRHGVVAAAVAERLDAADSYALDRTACCTAHDLVPPLFVSVAQAWLSAGEPERALALVDRRRGEALATRLDDLTVRYADVATVAIARRLRLDDRQSVLVRLAAGENPGPTALGDSQLLAWRALAVVSPRSFIVADPSLPVPPQQWHAWWQSRGPRTSANQGHPRSAPQAGPTSADVADIQADLAEARWLGPLLPASIQSAAGDWDSALSDWLERPPPPPPTRSAEPHRELRAVIRMAALAGEVSEIPPQVPLRLFAEMAFEEAELTALRIPAAASLLFLTAAVAYRAAGDPLGEYLAWVSVLLAGYRADGPAATRPDVAAEAAGEALRALTGQLPSVPVALDAPPEDAGLWRNWTPAGRVATGWAWAVSEAAELSAGQPAFHKTTAHAAVTPSSAADAAHSPPAARPGPPAGGTTAGAPPPAATSARAAPRATRPRLRIALVTLAVCLVAGLGALGLSVLLSGRSHSGGHPRVSASATSTPPFATTAVATPPTSTPLRSPSSTPASSPSSVVTSHPPPQTSTAPTSSGPASTALASTAPASTAPASTAPASTAPASTAPASTAPGSGESPLPWIAALIAALAVAALLGWCLPRVLRLAKGQGIGASRRAALRLYAKVAVEPGTDPGEYTYVSSLQAGPRPWRTAPAGARAVLWFLIPAVGLAALLRRGTPGYHGADVASDAPAAPRALRWTDPQPAASPAWWRGGRGTALGIIRGSGGARVGDFMTEPWERTLVASLSPDAAGRIEWIRVVDAHLPLLRAPRQQESTLLASAAWTRALDQYYSTRPLPPFSTGLLHVIGRAVATSAGPAMDVIGEPATDPDAQQPLLGVTEIRYPEPAMVVLQAEPAPGAAIDAGPPDDQAEKLRLGAALAADGIPAVLLLPVVPARIADELARIVTEHARLRLSGDEPLLLTRLRAAAAPHVPPQVLDDVVLFLNVENYRSYLPSEERKR